MKLEEFVAESLRQIINGIKTAQLYAKEQGASVVPERMSFRTSGDNQLFDKKDGTPIDKISFDVAVTTLDGTTTKGGIGIFVGAIGLGSQGQSDSSSQYISRLQFSIPIIYPKSVQE